MKARCDDTAEDADVRAGACWPRDGDIERQTIEAAIPPATVRRLQKLIFILRLPVLPSAVSTVQLLPDD